MVSFGFIFHITCNVGADCFEVVATKERFHSDDVILDSRIIIDKSDVSHRAIICIPIFLNRGQLYGAVYYADQNSFQPATITMQSLLCHQASISIANALLFQSLQLTTQDNLKVINLQTAALKAARRSEEQALQATKVPAYQLLMRRRSI